jgi:hypothetical protein
MKTKDCSKKDSNNSHSEHSENLMNRREALNKAGLYALSATTMMVLLKSQSAKAQSAPAPNVYIAPKDGTTETWQRTTRNPPS